jgi:hypothetical protein|tara:strand:+ start:394 stop:777 length:384 start_codon:yes stop_codon:yes gene_type:complete
MKLITTDGIGIISGSLCLIHCVATPFIFIAKACSVSCCSDAPLWWQSIDYLFLIISFIAIYFVSKNTTNQLLKVAFWLSWAVLLVVILNQSFELFYLPKNLIYVSSFLIITLHLYNIKYNSCEKDCK